MPAFMTNDGLVFHCFVYLVDFAKLLPKTNFVTNVFESMSASAKNCQVALNDLHLLNVGNDINFSK